MSIIPIVKRHVSDVCDRLKELGYLPEDWKLDDVIEAIKRFQTMHGLNVDGDAGPLTQRAMFAPKHGRCGLPDIMANRTGICKWPVEDVPLWPRLSLSRLSDDQIIQAFRGACEDWNAVCGINLTIASTGDALIVADSGRGRRDQFDGAGGTLAWSELPCGMRNAGDLRTLQQKYDTEEPWTPEFLRTVACHEIGHAIGIEHLSAGNLMAPFYDPRISKPQSGDILEAVKRYGPAKPKSEPSPQPDRPDRPVDGPGDLVGRRFVVEIVSESRG